MDERGLTPSPAVDAACDRFEERWRRREDPDPADHAADVAPDERPALSRELVLLDMDWRRRLGQTVTLDYYASRFPDLDVASLWRQAGLPDAASASPRFEKLERLGAGSFGTTWRARDATLGREVALKLSHSTGGEADRFHREARAAARLRHPGIAAVHETLELDGCAALVTELVAGPSLAARLETGWKPTPREAASLVAAVADALQHAHELGVVHRDVKPGNVVVESATGRPVLVDFGLASDAAAATLTADGHVLGTPAYMSPEQAVGDARGADERSDVYSCGAVLYELLTGRPPFAPGPGLLDRVAREEPVAPRRLSPDVPRDLETIALTALAKDRRSRYPSAAALARDLRSWLDGRPITARPPTPFGRAARWARREPALASSLLIVAALLAALAIVGARAARDIARQRDAAVAALDRARLAEAARQEQIFESRLAEAAAIASSTRAGRRFGALDAIDAAAAQLALLPPRADRERRLRSILLTASCLTDMRPTGAMALPPGTTGFAFSRDLTTWARADELGAISVRGVARDDERALLPGPGVPVERLEFSPDGERLAVIHAGRGPATFVAWDWRSSRAVARLHPSPPWTSWSAEGHALYAEQAGRTLARLSLDDDAIVPVPAVRGRLLAVGPRGRALFTDGADLRRLHVASLRTGEVLGRMRVPEEAWVGCLDPATGEKALVSSGLDAVLLDVASGEALATMKGHQGPVTAVAISDDGRWGASHGWDGVTHAWDLERGLPLARVLNALPGMPTLAFTSGDRALLAHSDGVRAGPLDLALDVPLRELDLGRLVGGPAGWAHLSDDGTLALVWADAEGYGRSPSLLDLDAGRVVAALPDPGTIGALLLPGSVGIVTSGPAGLRAWPILGTGAGRTIGPPRLLVAQPTGHLAIGAGGKRYATTLERSGEVVVGRLDDGTVTSRFLPRRRPWTIALDESGDRVALGSWHGRVATCHDAQGRVMFERVAKSSAFVAFSPVDGSLVVHGGDELHLLDPDTGAPRAALILGGGRDVPTRVAFAPEAGLAIVIDSRRQGSMRWLDAKSLDEIAALDLPGLETEALLWCALDRAAKRLCAGTASGRMLLWDVPRMRSELRARGLDWSDPVSAPASVPASASGG